MQTLDSKSLSVQLVISLVGLALLTALMVGLPAIWLIRTQLEDQAWAQVHQGVQATQALYAAREQDLDNLATLTAQRPSLRSLLQPVDLEALTVYLETLRQGADLDWIAVCDTEAKPIAQVVGETTGALPSSPCTLHPAQIVPAIAPTGEMTGVWLISGEPIKTENEQTIGAVIVGRQLDAAFAAEMRSQTGLDHTVLLDDIPVVTSLIGGATLIRKAGPAQDRDIARSTFAWAGKPYYANRLILQAPANNSTLSIQAEVALAVDDVVAAEQRLVRVLLGSITLASVVGFVLAVFLARRISRPLGELAGAATAMSRGDLSKPFTSDTRIREVALVGKALNGARTDLQQTLDELRREKAWTDHLLSAIVEGIVTLDRQGFITYFSQGAERITGLGGNEVIGHNCDMVFATINTDRPFSALIPTPGGRSKITLKRADGKQAILAFTGARLLPPEGGDAAWRWSSAISVRRRLYTACLATSLPMSRTNFAHR